MPFELFAHVLGSVIVYFQELNGILRILNIVFHACYTYFLFKLLCMTGFVFITFTFYSSQIYQFFKTLLTDLINIFKKDQHVQRIM